MSAAYLDTHVALWLHDGLVERLSNASKKAIEENDLLISPMVLLELQYLYERQRVRIEAGPLYAYLNAAFGIALCSFPFPAVAREAVSVSWTDDPFDRMIVGQAKANHSAVLVTADTQIRRHYQRAVW